ncbi:hypothetical protein J4221_05025 [Candidatus Pacearchaeota archaeon]|nr:hypothetical protein [Candidatus Pacearchaeota archaeon]
MESKAQIDVLNLIAGITIIVGGIFILFSKANGGLIIVGIGTLIKAVEIAIKQGI